MTQAIVNYDGHHARVSSLLSAPIAKIVAEALNCTGKNGHLSPDQVKIKFQEFGDLDETRGCSVIIQIDADDCTHRQTNFQTMNDNIAEGIQQLFSNQGVILSGTGSSRRKISIETRLIPTAYTEFEI
mgnify:CR=1 FL=1